mgnify:CR=1 FL=1|jgi:two-component system chemotaxis response regulator CheY
MMIALLVSSDQTAVSEISQIASASGIAVKTFPTLEQARRALASEKFDSILVDASYGMDNCEDLLILGWKHNALLVGGIFNLAGPIKDPWHARLYGAQLFSGYSATENIRLMFQSLPKVNTPDRATNKKILYVEDLDSPRVIVTSYIKSLGYPLVANAERAEQALAMLSEHPHDYFCVLTDILMPEINGIELTRRIRRDAELKHLPIIVLTAVPSAMNLIECVKAGATGFLVKPPIKRLLKMELEKAWRIYIVGESPRLCNPDDAHFLEESLNARFNPTI